MIAPMTVAMKIPKSGEVLVSTLLASGTRSTSLSAEIIPAFQGMLPDGRRNACKRNAQ